MAADVVMLRRRGEHKVINPETAFLLNGQQRQIDFRDAMSVSFETCSPARQFPSWRGKRNYAGSYWSSTNHGHIGFESLYERTALMVLDRETSVVAISSQPMWIFWPDGSVPRSHAPDFFLRHSNGDGEIVDVRPRQRIDETAALSFEATRRLCAQEGFRYRVMSDLDPVLDQNLRFLSRYRDQGWALPIDGGKPFREYLGQTMSIRTLAAVLSEKDQESRALGWIYWSIWAGEIHANLHNPLGLDTAVELPRAVLQ